MFITPISIKEYLTAHMISGAVKGLLIFLIFSTLALYIFHLNIFSLGPINLAIFYINLTLFAWSTGIMILGAIFRFGTRIQALAWGLIFLFQPLTASLFPVKILPVPLQILSYFLPPTFVFEAARSSLTKPGVNWEMAAISLAENLIYFVLTIIFFNAMFKKAKDTGQFARNEG
jgi:ABC-2 type transport system permease protein